MRTGLEPATHGVTGRYSNQLNYRTFTFNKAIKAGKSAANIDVFSLGAKYVIKKAKHKICLGKLKASEQGILLPAAFSVTWFNLSFI